MANAALISYREPEFAANYIIGLSFQKLEARLAVPASAGPTHNMPPCAKFNAATG